MSMITGMEVATIYGYTTAILGTTSLIMGTTLLMLCGALGNNTMHSKLGLKFLAAAMFMLSIINLLEFIEGTDGQKEQYSLSIVIFAASTELFLIFMAYMSMLCKAFTTHRRIFIEIGYIVLFTTPPLFVSPHNQPLLFDILFVVSLTFYCVKFLLNYIIYQKQIKKTKRIVKNLLSNNSRIWLKWVNSTFYVVLVIGITSIIAPMTNLTILVFYNSFIFVAYLYVYFLIIKKINIFDRSMSILESGEVVNTEECSIESGSSQHEDIFMDSIQRLLNKWIAERGYAVSGITAAEVAIHLGINHTKLSHYLKNKLNTTYYDWIAQLRIEDAKQQLTDNPNKSIYEIALNVGIEDRDNFRHLFKKIAGVSPTTYRKQNGH